MEKVILVDKKDRPIGISEKLTTHRQGKLHRAFSIFVFNSKGETLLQQRALSKYHSPGLWSNTCCSHPRPHEDLKKAAQRRLKEEMGIDTDLKEIFSFIYQTKLSDLIEHEFDHVFLGKFDGHPKPNKKEVKDWKWVNLRKLKKEIKEKPAKYTFWLRKIFAIYEGNKFKFLS